MPTYDYQCRECGHTIEVIHSMKESGPDKCERCGGELRRVLFPAGIIFKGSGFYKTDSRSGGSAAPSTSASAKPSSSAEPKASTGDSGSGASDGSSTPAKDAGKKESA